MAKGKKAVKSTKRSDIAAWCRTFDCKLNGKLAVICGWSNDFATIAALDGSQQFDWAWETVDRIMRRDRNFIG